MDLKLMATALCRTPVFCPGDRLEKHWAALKELIRESSPEFYGVIGHMDHEQLKAAGDKINFTVWKYFNRSKFRATPFGSMATISILPVIPNHAPPVLGDSMIKHCFTDWSEHQITRELMDDDWLRLNATCYKVGRELRYTRLKGTQFELAALPLIPELESLLSICRDKTRLHDIYPAIAERHGIPKRVTADLVRQMLDQQLLLSDRYPNITGPDYFDRLKIGRVKAPYIIAERGLCSGALDPATLNTLPGYFRLLEACFPAPPNDNLEAFKNHFGRKFGQSAVPLAVAIDPETGIDYGDVEVVPQQQSQNVLLAVLTSEATGETRLGYTATDRFLLNAIAAGGPIRLENYKEAPQRSTGIFPNTFSALISFCKGTPVIESAGGCTANALLGRFTLISGDALSFGKEIAGLEQNANPHILFFDIAYQAEKLVDNVNRRPNLYKSELPLLSWSCHDTALSLDDISVMVRDGEIMLWSARHRKRLVPRVASAYNYTRSDLPVYRFLCDLQHQGLCTDLTFRLQRYFPGLDHYPRVLYKDIVVSAARWKVNFTATSLAGLKKWLAEKSITFLFKCGNGDQTLLFDPANDHDLESFLLYHRQNNSKEIYITEALSGDVIMDRQGNSRIPQYIVNFSHEQQVYRDYRPPSATGRTTFPPGSEWLYYEVYCHPSRANQVLQTLRRFAVSVKQYLQHWFFIRYTDPEPHIRLRLKLKGTGYTGYLMGEIRSALQELLNLGLVTDVQIKTYIPESARYGPDRMCLVERIFHLDSVYTLGLLSQGPDEDKLYHYALRFMSRLLALAELKDMIGFITMVAAQFSAEFRVSTDGYKQINKSFEQLKNAFDPEPAVLSQSYKNAFLKVMGLCSVPGDKERMVADLLHMHINRLFSARQREHEAILYHYLLKFSKAQQFRAAALQAL